jgi:hypothetical protein
MNRMNLTIDEAMRRASLGSICLLIISAGYVLCGPSPRAVAQALDATGYRVGGLIENGFLGAPKGWTLSNFAVDKDQWIHRKGQPGGRGTAKTTFLGPDGFYKIRVQYWDEGDGVSKASVLVGGRTVGSWAFDGILIDGFRWKEFDGVEIKKGDEIVLSGSAGGYEYCRIRGVEILPSKPLPAAPAAAAIEPKEYSMNLVPVRGGAAQAGAKYLIEPNRFFEGGAGTQWIYLTKGQVLSLRARSGFAGQKSSLEYSLTKVGAAEPIAAETLVSESIQPIYLRLPAAEEGVYELKVAPAPGVQQAGVLVQFDAPAVKSPGAGEGYFFVPKGTKVFSVKTSGHTVILDAAGKVVLDELFDNAAVRAIEVPAGSDNQVWYFQGAITVLNGVPPYIAAHPDAMLAPREVLQ